MFDHFDGTSLCPPKFVIHIDTGVTKDITLAFQEWETIDLALLSLLLAILSDDAIEHVLGCRTAHEAWSTFENRYVTMSKCQINMLRLSFRPYKKGPILLTSIFLRDQLIAAWECIFDNDLIIAAFAGLPREHAIIRTIILARDTFISLEEFRAQLLNTERNIKGIEHTVSHSMATMYMQGSLFAGHGSGSSASHFGSHEELSFATIGTNSLGTFYPNSMSSSMPSSNEMLAKSSMTQPMPQIMHPYMPQQFHQEFLPS